MPRMRVAALSVLYKTDSAATLIRGMVEPLAAAHRNAVVAGKPLFPPGFDEHFPLPEKKFFEINGCGTLFLLWGKFNKFADFSHHFLLLQRFLF